MEKDVILTRKNNLEATKKQIVTRIATLKQEGENRINIIKQEVAFINKEISDLNVKSNAIDGAISDCDFWLNKDNGSNGDAKETSEKDNVKATKH